MSEYLDSNTRIGRGQEHGTKMGSCDQRLPSPKVDGWAQEREAETALDGQCGWAYAGRAMRDARRKDSHFYWFMVDDGFGMCTYIDQDLCISVTQGR